jgi:aconitate hydratase
MGVLPLQFKGTDSWASLGIRGDERFDIRLASEIKPQQDAALVITDAAGAQREVPLVLRIDTPIEVDYYRHGGILPFVLRQLLAA